MTSDIISTFGFVVFCISVAFCYIGLIKVHPYIVFSGILGCIWGLLLFFLGGIL